MMVLTRKMFEDRPVLIWPILLVIVLQIIYLVVEVGFNASLLNVATGATGNDVNLSDLEVFGRLVAGVGLGLLLFSRVATRLRLNRYPFFGVVGILAVNAVLIFSLTIPGMWYFQKWLIDDVVLASQTTEQRQAARYVQYLAPAMRRGLVSLDDLPVSTQNLDRPDTKTALILLAPLLLDNDRIVRQIAESVPEIVKFMAHQSASSNLEDAYAAFSKQRDVLNRLWGVYEDVWASVDTNPAAAEVRKQAGRLSPRMVKAYQDYYRAQTKAWYDIGDRVRKTVNRKYSNCKIAFDPRVGPLFRMGGACQKNEHTERSAQMETKTYGFPLSFSRFCPNHNQFRADTCIAAPETTQGTIAFAKQLVDQMPSGPRQALLSRHAIRIHGGRDRLPITLGPAEFFNHSAIRSVRRIPRLSGLTDRDFGMSVSADGRAVQISMTRYIDKLAEAAGREAVGDIFVKTVDRQLDGWPGEVDPNAFAKRLTRRGVLSQAQFFDLPEIQSLVGESPFIAKALNMGHLDVVSADAFFQHVVIPVTLESVKDTLGKLPVLKVGGATIGGESKQDVHMLEDDALRAIYVPAIALAFSLFFSLANMVSLLQRFVWLGGLTMTVISPTMIPWARRTVFVAGYALIVSLPVYLTPNALVHSQMLDKALQEIERPYWLWPVRWVLAVQPVVYPVGNALLGITDTLKISSYRNPNAMDLGLEVVNPVDQVDFNQAFTVSDLQTRLNALGLDAGPVDGVIGPKTTNALKIFQKAQGLPPTGYQDKATIDALKSTDK